jgi:hypothetical protein
VLSAAKTGSGRFDGGENLKYATETAHIKNLLYVGLDGRQAEVALLVACLFQRGQERAQAGTTRVTHLAQVGNQMC